MAEEMLHYSHRTRERQPETLGAKLDQTKRGKAPRPRPPNEVDRDPTPCTAPQVFHALSQVWNPAVMRGPATQQAVAVLLAQWGVECADGTACHNWNLAGIKVAKPEAQPHYRMFTPDDFPKAKAEGMVAHAKRLRPDDPLVVFRDDKDVPGGGKLRVWQIACFRAWASITDGARGFEGLVAGRFARALPHVHAGEPEQYAHAISDEFMGENKGWFNAPSKAYQSGMRARFNRYMKMKF